MRGNICTVRRKLVTPHIYIIYAPKHLYKCANILACAEILSLCAETNSLCAETHLLCAKILACAEILSLAAETYSPCAETYSLCAEIFSSPHKFFWLCAEIIMSHAWILGFQLF